MKNAPALALTKRWYRNGVLHREDGPAMIHLLDGTEQWISEWWCRDGKLHRDDGPAIIGPDGTEQWWRNGVRYEFTKLVMKKSC